jgi:oligopeptide/dipeptide ABC transporter ATP-binding protein
MTGGDAAPPLLAVSDLAVEFDTFGGSVKAVRGVSFSVDAGRTLAIVGESGCGKSVTVQALMGLVPMPPGRLTAGSARLRGQDILGTTRIDGRDFRGSAIGMIFQIAETLEVHLGWSRTRALARAVELLGMTRIPDAAARAGQYPFEFSGGMLQRAMIAMAIACEPAILIADEPTTALDVTIQAQLLDLLADLQRDHGTAIILITHDLGVVARMADDVAVMYAGQIVEQGSVDDIFYRSAHPYTIGLRAAMPGNDRNASHRLLPIEGSPPDLFAPPAACAYAARCPYAMRICTERAPPAFETGPGHFGRCWLHHAAVPRGAKTIRRGDRA